MGFLLLLMESCIVGFCVALLRCISKRRSGDDCSRVLTGYSRLTAREEKEGTEGEAVL